MAALQWDETGSRYYEGGVDRAVLYLDNGLVVPWNGIISVSSDSPYTTSDVYYDGRKINNLVSIDSFKGRIRAFTYPDEFLPYEGYGIGEQGLQYGEQRPRTFSMAYRTSIGSDSDDIGEHYKIHVLYNVTAIPATKTYQTLSMDSSPSEFEWAISAVPEDVYGFRPTSHIIVDTRNASPWFVDDLEEILYGTETTDPFLPSIQSLASYVTGYDRLVIYDNEDGTWTAVTTNEQAIVINPDGTVTIEAGNVNMIDANTYEISSDDKEALWQQ